MTVELKIQITQTLKQTFNSRLMQTDNILSMLVSCLHVCIHTPFLMGCWSVFSVGLFACVAFDLSLYFSLVSN